MVGGRVLFTDSTHLKANANITQQKVKTKTKHYMKQLDAAVEKDRSDNGKKPLKPREEMVEEKEIKVSTTDPESGYM